jgi:isoleucyl-tRNA synthetase
MTSENTSLNFEAVDSKVDFIALEHRMMRLWRDRDVVARYLHRNDSAAKKFPFMDGPITANNPMGVHHAWGRSYKDIFLRFRNMQGYAQRFQNGFDGQGLWVEVEVEKEKGFKSKREIETYGIGKFVEDCKARVRMFSDRITEQSKRLGYFMDWDNSYQTMSDENNYTIWLFLKKCADNGWLYEGEDVMPWCPRCGTGLSQQEIVTEGYQEIVHPGFFLKFPLLERDGESLLVWTTTPWTLVANVAAAVNVDHDYVQVENTYTVDGEEVTDTLWLGSRRLNVLKGEHKVLRTVKGSELVGWRYRGPFDEVPAQAEASKVHRVLNWEDVGEEEGTGIVHIAPGAGAEDFKLGKEHGLPVIAPLDDSGVYGEGYGFLDHKPVSQVNDLIFDDLKRKSVYYRVEKYKHRYPVCWRCGTELVFRLVSEWFISMEELRPQLMEATRKMNWIPPFGEARELDWLKNMGDWMISKKRYWGLALPIWKCSGCGKFEVIGSEDELKERAIEGWDKFEGHSPHRPWIDDVKIACSACGSPVTRIPDVGNAWLDAGIVSFSTLGYRHNRAEWEKWYPAEWISESFPGQFRNWFYSLITMSVALKGQPPARSVFSYALMRDEKGEEMHKSKGNAIWFEDAAEKMGVDVMRWVYSRHNPASNLNFGYGPGDEVRRQFLIPLWNIFSFFTTYAALDKWTPEMSPLTSPRPGRAGDQGGGSRAGSGGAAALSPLPTGEGQGEGEAPATQSASDRAQQAAPLPEDFSELDRWIISETNQLVERVTEYMESWRIEYAAQAVEQYVDGLSNWYVRRSRRRFWKSENDGDKNAAYSTLYHCLTTLTRLLAPFIPFVTEEMYQQLVAKRVEGAPDSVHLADWPVADTSLIDEELSRQTQLAIRLASLGRSARAQSKLKVRQPLAELLVEVRHDWERAALPVIEQQVAEELNVKRVRDVTGKGGLLSYVVKPELRSLGPKYGKQLGEIRKLLEGADAAEIARLAESGQQITLGDFTLEPAEVLVERHAAEGYAVTTDAGYTAAVSTEVTPELRAEGIAREVVHIIQNLRKTAGLEISDRIDLGIEATGAVSAALTAHTGYLVEETLAASFHLDHPISGGVSETHEIDGEKVTVSLRKA